MEVQFSPPPSAVTENGRQVSPANALDLSGMEVCQLEEQTLDICEMVTDSQSGTELSPDQVAVTEQGPANLESFNTVVSDLTQILLSQDEATVISSAQ